MKKNPPRREDQPDRFRVILDWYSLISKSAEPKTNTKGQRLDLDRLLRPKTNDMIRIYHIKMVCDQRLPILNFGIVIITSDSFEREPKRCY